MNLAPGAGSLTRRGYPANNAYFSTLNALHLFLTTEPPEDGVYHVMSEAVEKMINLGL